MITSGQNFDNGCVLHARIYSQHAARSTAWFLSLCLSFSSPSFVQSWGGVIVPLNLQLESACTGLSVCVLHVVQGLHHLCT